ncbi:MAG: LptF/LptG family permease [Synergistaceae bacterium]|nr:LptF/LptG family permease [Synergistaceae bacterium]
MRSKFSSAFPGLRILDYFIVKEMAGPFVFGMMIFTMILVAGDLLFEAAKLVIERGVALSVVCRLFFYRLPEVIAWTLPMSCLLSTLLSMTRLSSNSELIAIRSLGIPFRRVLRPIITASFFVAAGALLFTETIVPFTAQAADTLMRYEILKNQASAIQDKVFMRDESGGELRRVVYVDKLDVDAGTMEGIMLYEFDRGRMTRSSSARGGTWLNGEWWLDDGQVFEMTEKGEPRLLFRFERQKLALNISPEQLRRSTKRPDDMSARELWDYARQAGAMGAKVSQLLVIFHLKLAVPWSCVVLAVLGASFGAFRRGRSGSSAGFGFSVVIVFGYYMIMSVCRALGESGNMAPMLAAWTPNGIFLAGGIYFSRKVD